VAVAGGGRDVDGDGGPLLLGESRMDGDSRADLGFGVGGEPVQLRGGEVGAFGEPEPDLGDGVVQQRVDHVGRGGRVRPDAGQLRGVTAGHHLVDQGPGQRLLQHRPGGVAVALGQVGGLR
jgi:hypothetical protein